MHSSPALNRPCCRPRRRSAPQNNMIAHHYLLLQQRCQTDTGLARGHCLCFLHPSLSPAMARAGNATGGAACPTSAQSKHNPAIALPLHCGDAGRLNVIVPLDMRAHTASPAPPLHAAAAGLISLILLGTAVDAARTLILQDASVTPDLAAALLKECDESHASACGTSHPTFAGFDGTPFAFHAAVGGVYNLLTERNHQVSLAQRCGAAGSCTAVARFCPWCSGVCKLGPWM